MNITTEARNESSGKDAMESNDKNQAPSGGRHGRYGILTVVLVALAGLVAALVIESSNSSSSNESPRELAPSTPVVVPENQSHREADLYPATPNGDFEPDQSFQSGPIRVL